MLWKIPTVEEIVALRKRLFLSQSKLAKQAKISQSALNKFERGQIDMGYLKVTRIANVMMSLFSKEIGERSSLSNFRARDIMEDNIVWFRGSDKVAEAVNLMTLRGFSQIPVKKGGRFVGSISERIIVAHLDKGIDPRKLDEATIDSVMGPPFPKVSADIFLDAVSVVLENTNAVLVTDEGQTVGIITPADFLKLPRMRAMGARKKRPE